MSSSMALAAFLGSLMSVWKSTSALATLGVMPNEPLWFSPTLSTSLKRTFFLRRGFLGWVAVVLLLAILGCSLLRSVNIVGGWLSAPVLESAVDWRFDKLAIADEFVQGLLNDTPGHLVIVFVQEVVLGIFYGPRSSLEDLPVEQIFQAVVPCASVGIWSWRCGLCWWSFKFAGEFDFSSGEVQAQLAVWTVDF